MEIKDVAVSAARKAGKILLELSKEEIRHEMKGTHDILAEADLKTEKAIIEEVRRHFPDHSILSEEKGGGMKDSDYLWAVDPLDGTINFSRGIDEYCVSMAVEHKGNLIVGVIYQPSGNKLYVAERGKGAFLNGAKLKVSNETELIKMLLATDNSTTDMNARQKNYRILSGICSEVRQVRIFGSGALHVARIAAGELDIYFKTKFNYWDYGAGTLLIQEAGGKVTDFQGKEITRFSKDIVASNGKIHQKILDIINRAGS